MDVQKIKSIYQKLNALYAEAPKIETGYHMNSRSVWEFFNNLIDQLNQTKIGDFMEYKIEEQHRGDGYSYVSVENYRTKLLALIAQLQNDYLPEELLPNNRLNTSGQTINVNQNTTITLILDLGVQIGEAKQRAKTTEEKSFLEELTQKAKSFTTYIQFLLAVSELAQKFGINWEQIKRLFGG